jgi:pyrroline-5-carboxylate reductase
MTICFIGYGAMAKAIVQGLLKQGINSLAVSAPSLREGVTFEGLKTYNNNKEAIKEANIVVLAVKPKLMDTVLQEILPALPPQCLLISVAAGLTLSWFNRHGAEKRALIRTMPNTPASVGKAATPMMANAFTNSEHKMQAERIFSSIGITAWTDNEEDIDSFTALSGSGPAYVFAFMQAMVDAGVSLGLSEPIAQLFVQQTCEGAIQLAKASDLSLNQLKSKVTSPGGTTEAALNVLDSPLHRLIFETMKAAKNRSIELGTS